MTTNATSILSMTPTPLVLLGPGGDFASRLNVKGTALLRSHGPANLAHAANPDADHGSGPGYEHLATPSSASSEAASSGVMTPGIHRHADGFDAAAPAVSQTYGPDGRVQPPARVSILAAAAALLELQSFRVSDLAHDHEQHRRDLLSGSIANVKSSKPQVRVIRPPAPQRQGPPANAHAHAKAARVVKQTNHRLPIAAAPANPVPPVTVTRLAARLLDAVLPSSFTLASKPSISRKPSHEPHPQTTQDPQSHPRDAAHPRLFADDAGTRRRTGRLQSHRLRARRSTHQKGGPQAASQQSPLFGGLG